MTRNNRQKASDVFREGNRVYGHLGTVRHRATASGVSS